jgi:tetratricopeptide (TPR) repeat protein
MLPEAEWNKVVKNYSELYGNIEDYTNRLKALEKARDDKPDEPALRFLLGYHFGYLGYPQQAVRELDKALDLQPQDLGAEKLRDMFAVAAGLPARPHPPRDQAPGPLPPAAQPPAAQPPGVTAPAARSAPPPAAAPPQAPATRKVPQPPPPQPPDVPPPEEETAPPTPKRGAPADAQPNPAAEEAGTPA